LLPTKLAKKAVAHFKVFVLTVVYVSPVDFVTTEIRSSSINKKMNMHQGLNNNTSKPTIPTKATNKVIDVSIDHPNYHIVYIIGSMIIYFIYNIYK